MKQYTEKVKGMSGVAMPPISLTLYIFFDSSVSFRQLFDLHELHLFLVLFAKYLGFLFLFTTLRLGVSLAQCQAWEKRH